MPISFPNDSSTQQGGTFTSGSTYYSNVNSLTLSNTSNTLLTNINNKQDTLTASTALLGNGGSITNINWNNITTNKPTTFASDWSTLANKPSTFNPDLTNIYSKTQVDNITTLANFYNKTSADSLLAAKQATLIATTILLGVGSAITALDYSKITVNLPSTFPAIMTNIYSKTEIDTFLSAKQATLISTTNLVGVGSAITALDYGKITLNKPSTFPADMTNIYTKTETNTLLTGKENALTFSSPLTRTTNTIGIDLSSYLTTTAAGTTYLTLTSASTIYQTKITTYTLSPSGTATFSAGALTFDLSAYDTITARNTALGSYLPLAGGSMTGALNITGNINILSSGTNKIIFDNTISNNKIQLSSTCGLGVVSNGLDFYSSGGFTFYNGTLTTTIFSVDSAGSMSTGGTIYPSGGVSCPTATIIANSFVEGGTSLNSKYLSSTTAGTTYLKLDGTNSMTGTLTGTTINANTNLQEGGINLITKYQGNINATALTTTTISQSYPPSYLSASTSSIYNTLYGVGTYVATSGSDYPSQAFFQCLGANPSVYPGVAQWTSGGGFNTSGLYIGAARTIIGGVSTAGEFGSV